VSEDVRSAVERLAADCLQCYQCGQCTAACPSGWDFDEGPRRVVRLVLAGDADDLLANEDVWRCNECGNCTAACPMEVDTRAVMTAVRELQREHGGASCPERRSVEVAHRQLGRRPRIDNIAFGAAMVSRGSLPKDLVGSAVQGTASARSLLARVRTQVVEMTGADRRWPALAQMGAAQDGRPAGVAGPAATSCEQRDGRQADAQQTEAQPFFAGCALPQDMEAYRLTREVAAGLGLALAEQASAGCCGHPARGTRPTTYRADGPALTVCPACDAGLREVGQQTRSLWDALTEKARRDGAALTAAAPAFVPYVGCLGERDAALAALADAAGLAGAEMRRSYPSLHASCCGALGGMFRGETTGTRRLLDFAAAELAPVVTTCLLCRDNLRSGARLRKLPVSVYYWPEFFSAAGPAESAAMTVSATPASAAGPRPATSTPVSKDAL
jgi:Fe-S oxidoreductase